MGRFICNSKRPWGDALALLAARARSARRRRKPAHAAAAGSEIPEAKPESVGFSAERLARLDGAMKALVDSKKLAGMVTVLARHGKVVEEKTYGYADVAGQKPMQKDTIVRIYSMTKPITGIAMMMLYEEGKWKPSDPIARYIPEFRDLKVYSGVDKDGNPTLDKPGHAPTMGELMSHSAGFTYGVFGSTPVDKMYQEADLLNAPESAGIHRIAWRSCRCCISPEKAGCTAYPSTFKAIWLRSCRESRLPDFLRERIFVPLGMKDTGFYVPAES